MPDYHRLDLSVTLKGKQKPGKNGMVNGTCPFTMFTTGIMHGQSISRKDPQNPNVTYAEKTYLFAVVPAITYNFKF